MKKKTIFFSMKFSLLLLLFVSMNAYAQQGTMVSGVVSDNGEPIPGVSVRVKGTSVGDATNIDGKYTITVPGPDAVLVFSYIGYITAERTVGSQREININLIEDTQQMDEVVVVGYGTQKKVNMTGSIAAVTVDENMSNRALSNVSSGLQGLLPGLAVSQNSAMVGSDNVSLYIRGMGSVNNATPLIVVDGMPGVDINRLNMNDIETISVLKDAASSAVYGSRAANGVILITTRSGKSQTKSAINFTANYSIGKPVKVINYMADYPRALEGHRAAAAVNDIEASQQFKKGTIDEWLAMGMIDPVAFPNTYWWDWIIRDQKMQNYNVSASGGSERSNYFASVGVSLQDGLMVNNSNNRYNARFNFDTKVFDNVNIGFRFSGNWTKYQYFQSDGFTPDNEGTQDMEYAISGIYPYDATTGFYGGTMAYGEDLQAYNPYAYYMQSNNNRNRQEINPNAFIDWTIIKGLVARLDYSINYWNQLQWSAGMPTQTYNFQLQDFGTRWYVASNAGVSNNTTTGYKTVANARLNYNVKIAGHHDISLLALYSEEYTYQRVQNSSRNDRIHTSLHELDAALTTVQSTSGNSWAEGIRSVVGRANYTAYDKYLLELNLRADGSSRLFPGHQWGFFPSASVGWRFNEEQFMKPIIGNWLTNGKFRLSYGTLGNVEGVDRYEQSETLATSNYMINGSPAKGFVNNKMINRSLSWESTNILNIGLDLGFLKNRLTTEFDVYDKLTTGMIRPSEMSIHLTGAYSAPRVNIGELRTRGLEMNLTWRERTGDFNYMVNLNFTTYRSKLEKWNEFLDKGYEYINMPYRYVYSYLDTGIAQTWQEVYDRGTGSSPGDILRVDVNGDGRYDANDKVAYPQYQRQRHNTDFALNANASWKGFDASVVLGGQAGRKNFWINNYNNTGINRQRYAFTWEHMNYIWSWDNRDGEWPRYSGSGNREETTYWLDSMAYLRLRNVQIGYSLPKKWLKKIHIENFRIYGSGDNLAILTKWRGIDPEIGGRGNSGGNGNSVYPSVRNYTVGINVGF